MDFQSAEDAGFAGMPDEAVLACAAQEGRILVTLDRKTMPGHFGQFLSEGNTSPGVFLVRAQATIHDVIEDLLFVWAASDPKDWENRIVVIPE